MSKATSTLKRSAVNLTLDSIDNMSRDGEIQHVLLDQLPGQLSSDFCDLFTESLDILSVTKTFKLVFNGISLFRARANAIKINNFISEARRFNAQWGDFNKVGIEKEEFIDFILDSIERFENYTKAQIQSRIADLLFKGEIDEETFRSLTYSLIMIHPMALTKRISIKNNGEFTGSNSFFESVGFAGTHSVMGGDICTVSQRGRIFIEKCLNPVLRGGKNSDKKVYNKLVRDRIPEIIRADGKQLKSRILNDEEHLEVLLKKLEEECAELAEARNIEELADVYEVLRALAEALGIKPEELEKVRSDKAAKRGGFQQKIFLESVNEAD